MKCSNSDVQLISVTCMVTWFGFSWIFRLNFAVSVEIRGLSAIWRYYFQKIEGYASADQASLSWTFPDFFQMQSTMTCSCTLSAMEAFPQNYQSKIIKI